MGVDLRVLGHTELSVEGRSEGIGLLRQPKRLALLAYLALAASSGFRRRDQIVAMFWPERDQFHARTQLRKSLHALRAALGPDALLTRGGEEIGLDEARVCCDAVAFRRHVEAGRWGEALTLYRGDLLEGLYPGGVGEGFESWLLNERAALRRTAARAAWECSSRADVANDRAEAIAFAKRAIELEPDDEQGIRRLIAALDRYGDRAGALRVFEQWRNRVQSEFGAEPSPETRKLARKVQAPRKGESAETPAIIRSLVAADVAALTAQTGERHATRAPATTPRVERDHTRSQRFRALTIAAAIAGVMLLIVGAFAFGRASGPDLGPAAVAILPFNGFGDSVAKILGETIAEDLTTALTQAGGMRVRTTTRSRDALAMGSDIRRIGSALKTRHVVDGAVTRDAQRVHVTVRLVRASDGVALWASSVDVPANETRATADRVTQIVSGPIATRVRSASP